MARAADPDVLIIGGGHNGLVCAFYLARAGLKVTVLERRAVVGGAAVTEEFHPGFRNSVASYTVSLLNPKVDRRHGPGRPRPDDRRAQGRQLPAAERRPTICSSGEGRTAAEVAKFSDRDAERLGAYGERLEAIADVLRGMVLETPPNVVDGRLARRRCRSCSRASASAGGWAGST